MVKSFQVDNELHERFTKAVSCAHDGHSYGNISLEHRKALENHIKVLEAMKK